MPNGFPGQPNSVPSVRTRLDGQHVAVVTLDRPPTNALGSAERRALINELERVAADNCVRCAVLTGTGSAFTSGADLQELDPGDAPALETFLREFRELLQMIETLRVPVIAAINGSAVGGGLEVALACDIRVAAEEATFVAAGVNIGLVANSWRLVRAIGLSQAMDVLLTGERVPAADALRYGLITEVYPSSDLIRYALEKAHRIASRAPLSVEATKESANLAPYLDREAADQHQAEWFRRLVRTGDHAEAVEAFFGRRSALFRRG